MGKVILIVEDEEKNLRLAHDLLQLEGYTILEARNGREGIDIAEEKGPDLILMDIQMPVMDGIEATKIIKNGEKTKGIPVIALTSYAMPGDEERICGAGCDGYITKPIDFHEFFEIVEKHMKE
ncbi:MAG: response regulator [Candidatus Latescibacteria bacterium]|jgi:two-component system, cell cycle response regulator DivK|nr:response regulator [Candidatus Latescibacterota bacterium]